MDEVWRAPSEAPTLPQPRNLRPNGANGNEFKRRPGSRRPRGAQLWLGAGAGPHYKAFIHSLSLSPRSFTDIHWDHFDRRQRVN